MPAQTILPAAAALAPDPDKPEPLPSLSATHTYHRTEVDGVGLFYREAGPPRSCCCTAIPHPRGNGSRCCRCWPTATI